MKANVVNLKGEKLEEISLSDKIFGIEPNNDVLKQYVRVYYSNQRQGTSSTKNKSEVSGGGSKPWQQKGTGRARQGSTRNPTWVHGGVAHGPKPKDWGLSLTKKMKELALKSALSLRMSERAITILDLDKDNIEKPSTKNFSNALEKLKIEGKTLIVWCDKVKDSYLIKSARNIPAVYISNVGSLGAFDVMRSNNIIFLKDSILKIEERYSK